MANRIKNIAKFIKDHGITPSPSERFIGMRDTIFAWAITSLTFTFYETPNDPTVASVSFFVKFLSGCIGILFYVLFESICRGGKFSGINDLWIKDYNETATHEIHLNVKQRKKFIYTRCAIGAGAYIALNISKDLFGFIDNSAIFGADSLIYAILASYVFLQKFSIKEWVGILVAFLGVGFILFFDIRSFSWQVGVTSGIAGICSAVFFTVMFFISSVIIRHDTPIRIAFHQCVIGGLLSLFLLAIVLIISFFSQKALVFPVVPLQIFKDSIIVGLLYAFSLVFFLRAWLFTEPIIIAMLGYSMGIFAFIFEWFFKKVNTNYLNFIGNGAITIGCSFLIYQEYIRDMLENKRWINLKPVYQKSLKNDLINIEDKFHSGELNKYEYLNEKHEFNKILLEYSNLIKNSPIKKIEMLPDKLIFTFHEYNIQMEADGGARSAPFEILNFGNYEPEDETLIYSLIKNGDTVFDIGAHIGWYSINIAKRYPLSEIYAFEPVKYTYDFLKNNIVINELHNVQAFNYGISCKNEEKELYYFKGGSAIASIENLIAHQNAIKVKCHLKTLDSIVLELGIQKINFLKCDVEGSELFVLQGAKHSLENHKPIIFLELYEEWCNKCGYSSLDVIKFLEGMGYNIYQALDGRLKRVEKSILFNNERYNYFFLNDDVHKNIIKTHSN